MDLTLTSSSRLDRLMNCALSGASLVGFGLSVVVVPSRQRGGLGHSFRNWALTLSGTGPTCWSFFSSDLLLQIWSEFVNEFINHAERKRHHDPGEGRAQAAIFFRIIGIRQTAGCDAAQDPRPIEGTP